MTHQITGVGVAAVTAAAIDPSASTTAVLVATAWLGSTLPDADKAGSHVYQPTRLERRHLPIRVMGSLVRLPLRLLALLPHRGVTHSAAACVLVAALAGALVSVVAPELALAAGGGCALGYVPHVAGDACTPSGVPLWAPLSPRRHWLLPRPARVPTGGLREVVAAMLLTVIFIAGGVLLTV
jgi:membrane-bound metal-dependent hydrolase YbcI (DUF457 family)